MYERKGSNQFKHFDFIVLDVLCLELAFLLAVVVRNGGFATPWLNIYRFAAMAFAVVDLIALVAFQRLHGVVKRDIFAETKQTFFHVIVVLLGGLSFIYLTQLGLYLSRFVVVATFVLYFLIGLTVRQCWKKATIRRRVETENEYSLLVFTQEASLANLVVALTTGAFSSYHVAGVVVTDAENGCEVPQGIPLAYGVDSGIAFASRQWVDEVLILLPQGSELADSLTKTIIDMGVTVHHSIAQMNRLEHATSAIERIGPYVVLTTSNHIVSGRQLFFKRTMDVFIGLVGCLATGLLCLILGPIIYFQSPGPIIFSQTRIGRGGKPFQIYKFRSMYMDAEARKQSLMAQNRVADGMMFKLDHDPRIIGSEKGKGKGIGNFIRRFSLDEFPQFYNVLIGNMSVVGTRPPTVDEWEKYELHHRSRLAIKPGITGMWQVSGRNAITNFEEVVALDREYIANWSLTLDIKILFKTVQVVFAPKHDEVM